jgi:hypothetical protein
MLIRRRLGPRSTRRTLDRRIFQNTKREILVESEIRAENEETNRALPNDAVQTELAGAGVMRAERHQRPGKSVT